MAYNANIPQATDQLSQSQPQILANFQALAGIAANTLPYLLVGPSQSAPTTDSTHMAFYTNTGSTGRQELFIERQTGTGLPASVVNTDFTSAVYNATGYTKLPSGIIIQWGTGTGSGTVTVNYALTFPNAVFSTQITPDGSTLLNSNFSVYKVSSSTTQLTVFITQRLASATGTGTFEYLAVGY